MSMLTEMLTGAIALSLYVLSIWGFVWLLKRYRLRQVKRNGFFRVKVENCWHPTDSKHATRAPDGTALVVCADCGLMAMPSF